MYLSKPPFSYSRQPQLPSLVEKERQETIGNNYGWLTVAKENIHRELEASKMELELIRDLLSELEVGSKIKRFNRGARDQLFLMRACQEYSGSRSCMLEERMRQIDLWLSEVRMGRDVPYGVPDEWSIVDIEWRRWLSEQATSRDSVSDRLMATPYQSDAVNLWGPLIPILTTYIEQNSP
ncbi:hypothetical protein F4814DRAFT_406262 [Daldinia grandis]|nr:hypothetical protein F4814DRAFT_406262 [Daldinia grandis]